LKPGYLDVATWVALCDFMNAALNRKLNAETSQSQPCSFRLCMLLAG